MNLLEKVASQLEKAADYIEKYETVEIQEKEKQASLKVEEDTKKRDKVVSPIKNKLAEAGCDDSEIELALEKTPTEALNVIKKAMNCEDDEDYSETVDDNWGSVEESKIGSKAKQAGYLDPLAAFAMGD